MRRLALTLLLLFAAGPAGAEEAPEPGAAATSTVPLQLDLNDAFLRANPDNLFVESRALDRPLLAEWWFWAAVAVGAAGIVATGVILSSGGTFAPDGELGQTTTADWNRF